MTYLQKLNSLVAQFETLLGALLAFSITILILLNVITRSIGNSLFWVDEAAISAMVWMGFLGASVSLHYRQSVAVTILTEALPSKLARQFGHIVDFCVLVFAIVLLILTWLWFDPLTLASYNFDTKAFSSNTFNFIYSEATTTLGFRKFWLWLIMPLFSCTLTLHALTNLFCPKETSSYQSGDVPLNDQTKD